MEFISFHRSLIGLSKGYRTCHDLKNHVLNFCW